MTVHRVIVDDLGTLSRALADLADDFDDIMEKAMRSALLLTGYFDEVWQRTPKSDRARYASNYRGVDLIVKQRGRTNDPSTWQATLPSSWDRGVMSGADTPRERDRRSAAIQRLNEYGMERLANSILPFGRHDRSLQVRRRSGAVELVLSSSVPYAARMHVAAKPREGEYWTPGKRTGWSAARTGNRYLELPYQQLQHKILDEFGRQVDVELHRRGLL